MLNNLININPIILSFIGSTIAFLLTSLGALMVLFINNNNKTIMDVSLAFSAGIMISASFWSLLNPGILLAEELGKCSWFVASIGFIIGGILLYLTDIIFERILSNTSSIKRNFLLVSSITIHNIPEGLAVGCAFGSLVSDPSKGVFINAVMLTLGIAIQNFPEGSAVSFPLMRDGIGKTKSFLIGSLSAFVEPISAVIGCILVSKVRSLLPFFLCFAAGAMIYVVTKELIPESQTNNNKNLITMFTMIGFTIMMILDVALG